MTGGGVLFGFLALPMIVGVVTGKLNRKPAAAA